VSYAVTGGNGTYSYYFATSGTTTSAYANATLSGSTLTVTPTGAGNDVLIISSGGQTAAVSTVTGSPFAASLPSAFGIYKTTYPAAVSATVPTTVTGAVVNTGTSYLSYSSVGSGSLNGSALGPGTGTVLLTDAANDTGVVPFTVFGLSFSTYQGAGSAANPNATAAEAFTGAGQTDTVTVTGNGGTLSATSNNTGIATVSVSGNTLTVNSVAAGTTGISLKDSATGASITYSVSVTTATIPISGSARAK
jgi:hypothetical protein